MKRSALLAMGLALGTAGAAEAQLSMQMGNGWNFTFSGNVNAFGIYETQKDNGTTLTPGGLIGVDTKGFNIRTGLLPAFAVFDAKGKEGNTDLGVHFGFAPQIQCGGQAHDCFGAQIDMRQVYLTVGGSWGQILAGRELGLFNRQNILTDQTLFGVGATGGINGGGTTLGRIGFGYLYPNFVAQMTYSTPAGKPGQLSIGLFQPASLSNGAGAVYDETSLPRVEAEGTYKAGNMMAWVNGTVQHAKNTTGVGATLGTSKTATGVGGGFRYGHTMFALVGSGYYGKGIGTTLQFNGVNDPTAGSALNGLGVDAAGNLRNSYGFIGQLTATPANSKMTFAASYGASYLKATNTETDFLTDNSLISGGLYYQATKSLKVVGEFNYAWTKDHKAAAGTISNKAIAPAVGMMLFF